MNKCPTCGQAVVITGSISQIEAQLKTLERNKAFFDRSHPEHKDISEKWDALLQQRETLKQGNSA